MGIPFQKALLTLVRLYMRPINKILVTTIKGRGQECGIYRFVVRFGNAANRFDIRLNRLLEGQQSFDGPIPDLNERRAFEVGIDWFAEVVFFYGLILSICFYEINKAEKARISQEKNLNSLENIDKKQLALLASLEKQVMESERENDLIRKRIKEVISRIEAHL